MASGEGYLTDTLMHEISHGLGPAYARTAARRNRYSKPSARSIPALEGESGRCRREFGMKWLVDHGAFPKEKQDMVYASYVAGIFRTIRRYRRSAVALRK